MTEQEFKDRLLLDVHRDISVINATLARIEVNVATHIKRTHLLEAKLESLEKWFWMANGATATLTVVAGLLRYFKAI